MNRISHLVSQLQTTNDTTTIRPEGVAQFAPASDDDIVIVSCIRTAIGKARRGSFKDTNAVNLLTPCLKYVIKDVDPNIVDDICVGTVLPRSGLRASECRMASFLAGMPRSTCVRTVNRQCSSGLQAIADIASAINSGYIEVGIAAGLESMTTDGAAMKGKDVVVPDEVKADMDALNCLLPMGITSENVAEQFGVTRAEQDEYSAMSHRRAAAAKMKFREEILPIKTSVKDRKTGQWKDIIVRDDDGVRPETTVEGLAKLRTVFKKNGTTTAGNSSQVSDGASALLMMKRSKAELLGLKPRARFVGFSVSGVDPAVMGIGPAFAIPRVLDTFGFGVQDIDLFEINEAFASQCVYSIKKLGLNLDKVNVNGGAIAFGHPLGCTGARMATTLINELERTKQRRGIVSMCIGSGMGAAGIFEIA